MKRRSRLIPSALRELWVVFKVVLRRYMKYKRSHPGEHISDLEAP